MRETFLIVFALYGLVTLGAQAIALIERWMNADAN